MARERPAPRGRILYVEDNEDLLEMMSSLLRIEGYDVVDVAHPAAGLRALAEQRFDLLLLDYNLPGMTGLDLLERARREGLLRGARAALHTALGSLACASDVPVFSKVLPIDELLAEIDRLVREGRAAGEAAEPSSPAANDGMVLEMAGKASA